MIRYILSVTHLPTGNCKECDTIPPDIKADFTVENLFNEFDNVYEKSVLLTIQMFPELFQFKNERVFFGMNYERVRTAGMEKIRFIVVMWMKDNGDVEYYIDKFTKNNMLNYDQRTELMDKYGVPKDMREKVDLMKRSIASIVYPSEGQNL